MDYDDYAERYRRNRFAVPWILDPLLEAIGKLPRAARVVELGCGTGNYSIALNEARSDLHYFGFDISKGMLEQARQRSAAVEFAEGDANARFPYPDDFADLSFCVDVLHHLTDYRQMFQELRRILRAQGWIIAVTDSVADVNQRSLTRFFPETRPIELSRYPDLHLLKGLARDQGFEEVERLPVRGELAIDAEFLRKLHEKCASSLRLIDDGAHQRGMQRVRKASEGAERWLSCYTVLRFVQRARLP
jgi:SAM-dependent methyltransferase